MKRNIGVIILIVSAINIIRGLAIFGSDPDRAAPSIIGAIIFAIIGIVLLNTSNKKS
jgi:tetrahydromethanopterin S-methyltransferase subunit C